MLTPNETRIDAAFVRTNERYRDALESLRTDCRSLVERMHDTLNNVDRALAGEPYILNQRGPVNDLGHEIDLTCMKIATLAETIRVLDRLGKQID